MPSFSDSLLVCRSWAKHLSFLPETKTSNILKTMIKIRLKTIFSKELFFFHFSKCQDDISKVSLLLWSCIELLSKQEERGVTIPIFYHHPLPQLACYPFSKNHSIVATSSIVNNNNSLFLNDKSLPNWNCQSNAL